MNIRGDDIQKIVQENPLYTSAYRYNKAFKGFIDTLTSTADNNSKEFCNYVISYIFILAMSDSDFELPPAPIKTKESGDYRWAKNSGIINV